MKLVKLIEKNFKILLRSRSAASIILLGPLLIMIIAGFAFNNAAPFELNIGIHDNGGTQTARMFTEALGSEYQITQFTDVSSCVKSIKAGKIHACVVYPRNFSIEEGKINRIQVLVDTSKTSIVSLVENSLDNVLTSEKSRISSDLAAVLVTSIDTTVQHLQQGQQTYINALDEQTTAVSAELGTIKGSVADLNMSYSEDHVSIKNIRDTGFSTENYASKVQKNAEDIYKELDSLVDDILEVNESQTNSIAEDAEDAVAPIKEALNQNTDKLEENRQRLINAIDNSQKKLDDLASRLDDADSESKKIVSAISLQQDKLSDIKNRIGQLDAALQQDIDRLSGIEITNVSSIVNPVIVDSESVITESSRLNYIFPTLMMFVIMFVSIMLASTLITREKLSPARFRIFITPSRDITFLLSAFLTVLILIALQLFIIIAVAHWGFGIDVMTNLLNVILVSFSAAFVFIFIGMCVGYAVSSSQSAILASVSIGTVFILISDLILPLESMPEVFQPIMAKTPFIMSSNLLRRAIIFNTDMIGLGVDFLILVLYALTLFVIITLIQKIARIIFILNHTHKKKR